MSDLRIETHKVRSVLQPRWWQVRWRYRMWRMRRDFYNARKGIDPALLERIDRGMDEAFLFGERER